MARWGIRWGRTRKSAQVPDKGAKKTGLAASLDQRS